MTSVGQASDSPAAGQPARSEISGQSEKPDRLAGLDGIRGLAALFVVLHHCWLVSFPGYPANISPMWIAWLAYGHLAVVVFIVLSGFSLAVGPARSDWELGGVRRFLRRRCWRILPPYWAALIFSLAIAWTLIPQPGTAAPTGKSVVVHGLLLQDIFGSPSPNGAFWSIAIEAQLYLVLPLMLLIRRRCGAIALLGSVTAIVVAIELLSSRVALVAMLQRLAPQMAALFAFGVVAAGAVVGRTRSRRLPWSWFALGCLAPALGLIVWQGRGWTLEHYFWVDLAAGPAVSFLLIAVSLGRPARLVRWLDTRPIRRLGSFSYSLYLTHAPLVVVLCHFIVAPHVTHGVPAFLVTLVVAVPVTLTVASVFAAIFERPFQRHRSFRALARAASTAIESRPGRRRDRQAS